MQETLAKTSVPLSCITREPIASKRFSISIGVKSCPKKLKKISITVKNKESIVVAITKVKDINTPILLTRLKKQKLTLIDQLKELPKESPLQKVYIVSTTSSKLSYIVEKVIKHQEEEKILIFYNGNNTAYYIT